MKWSGERAGGNSAAVSSSLKLKRRHIPRDQAGNTGLQRCTRSVNELKYYSCKLTHINSLQRRIEQMFYYYLRPAGEKRVIKVEDQFCAFFIKILCCLFFLTLLFTIAYSFSCCFVACILCTVRRFFACMQYPHEQVCLQ